MKKKELNKIKLIIDSNSKNEGFTRYCVTALAAQLDPTVEELADIRTMVSEAVTNSIIHGYKGGIGKITVDVRLYEDRSIYIRISDKGCGIENIKEAMEPLFTTDKSGERGGMGFAIMESFSDKLNVKSAVGKGTSVTMLKKLK